MTQTLIKWLEKELITRGTIRSGFIIPDNVLKQAEEIHRLEHLNTWDTAIKAHENRGHVISRSLCDFDDYYNETLKK
jgi:hypothetical protein